MVHSNNFYGNSKKQKPKVNPKWDWKPQVEKEKVENKIQEEKKKVQIEESGLSDKQKDRIKSYWKKDGMSVADQAKNICDFEYCSAYIHKLGFKLREF